MENDHIGIQEAVINLFRELAGDRADRLPGKFVNLEARRALQQALAGEFDRETAQDIAFHLGDWNFDAAFIMAMHLFPERFTKEQIRDGIELFLVHAPNHVAAAAKLSHHPVEDIFEVGALDGVADE